jgi:hypothetical protein
MMEEIRDTMAAAARAGAQVGMQMQHNATVNKWAQFADTLQEQLRNAREEIAMSQSHLRQKEMVIEAQAQLINKKDGVIASKNQIIAQKEVEIQRISEQARQQNTQMEEAIASAAKYRIFLRERLDGITRACGSVSAKLAVYEGIYELLVKEIKQIDNPERYKNLDPEVRLEAMTKIWHSFRKTSKVIYDPESLPELELLTEEPEIAGPVVQTTKLKPSTI